MKAVAISLSLAEVSLCERYARAAELGGQSSVREGEDRSRSLSEDQLVGQVATLAGCVWMYGKAQGHYVYRVGRWAADRAPEKGDGGVDVPGSNVDFKGSLIRHPGRPFEKYCLPVRPRERHEGNVYVLALVDPDFSAVHLLGWAEDSELPAPQAEGTFEGASTLPATELHPCVPLRWSL